MKVSFTKMQGAGNDFVVIAALDAPFSLSRSQLIKLGDRHFGVGADQILVVEPADQPDIDFRYRIFNGANGEEVEHCGNGARCFVRYVHDKALSPKKELRVQTLNKVLTLRLQDDSRVTVDMNLPTFDHDQIPFNAAGLAPMPVSDFEVWSLEGIDPALHLATLSMGNPHAICRVADVEHFPVADQGPQIQTHARFPRQVNAGFMEILSPQAIRLRVYERGAGETLSCGTGACAAVVAGRRLGWLDEQVDVHTRGGKLTIRWQGMGHPVLMTGPAETVFEGDITL